MKTTRTAATSSCTWFRVDRNASLAPAIRSEAPQSKFKCAAEDPTPQLVHGKGKFRRGRAGQDIEILLCECFVRSGDSSERLSAHHLGLGNCGCNFRINRSPMRQERKFLGGTPLDRHERIETWQIVESELTTGI
jgi:hypothetical protein